MLIFMYQWTFLAFNKLKQGGSFYVFGGIGIRNGFSFWNYVEEILKNIHFCLI
jgi:DNA modification methylase